jgi:2-oxoglutarate ferredoxin oxidoreductase subunit beta
MEGYRFIEIISQCPTAYGRRAGYKDAAEMLKSFKEKAVPAEQAEKMSEEELVDKIVVGDLVQRRHPTLVESIYQVIKEAKKSEQD